MNQIFTISEENRGVCPCKQKAETMSSQWFLTCCQGIQDGCQGIAMQLLTCSQWFLACFNMFRVVARVLLCRYQYSSDFSMLPECSRWLPMLLCSLTVLVCCQCIQDGCQGAATLLPLCSQWFLVFYMYKVVARVLLCSYQHVYSDFQHFATLFRVLLCSCQCVYSSFQFAKVFQAGTSCSCLLCTVP